LASLKRGSFSRGSSKIEVEFALIDLANAGNVVDRIV